MQDDNPILPVDRETILGVEVFRCIIMDAKVSLYQCGLNRTILKRYECAFCKNMTSPPDRPKLNTKGLCGGCDTIVNNNSRFCGPCQKINRVFPIGSPEWLEAVAEVRRKRETGEIHSRKGVANGRG